MISHAWLSRGAHVTSVGGTFGPELDADTARLGRVFVEWRGASEDVVVARLVYDAAVAAGAGARFDL